MRWLCFLSLASPALAVAQGSGSPSLHFDFAAVPATRDSFVFHFRGAERGWAVWQFEIRPLETTQQLVYTARSEFRPVEEERERVVLDRLTGAPLSTFHRIDLFSPTSDTVMMEHDLEARHGEISGRRRIGTKSGEVKIIPVSRPFAPGMVLGDYVLIAGAVSCLVPHPELRGGAADHDPRAGGPIRRPTVEERQLSHLCDPLHPAARREGRDAGRCVRVRAGALGAGGARARVRVRGLIHA